MIGYNILVIGIGNLGCCMVDQISREHLENIEYMVIDTRMDTLLNTRLPRKLNIGSHLTLDQTGKDTPEMGQLAAISERNTLLNTLKDASLVFLAAGLGDGIGAGATPVIATLAKSLGIYCIVMASMPHTQDPDRNKIAQRSHEMLKENTDALITHQGKNSHHQHIVTITKYGIHDLAGLILRPGLINFKFSDIRSVFNESNETHICIGYGYGPDCVAMAFKQAANAWGNEKRLKTARKILIIINSTPHMSLNCIHNSIEHYITPLANNNDGTYLACTIDSTMHNEMRVTIYYVDPIYR